jgi:hypothetical protein
VEADALLGDLSRGGEGMDVEAEKEDEQEKAACDKPVETKSAPPAKGEKHSVFFKRSASLCQEERVTCISWPSRRRRISEI